MNRKIPKQLAERQERQRQTTINTILRAISELKAEGYTIRIKDLMERTGFSRSVFSKGHVRGLLIAQGVMTVKPFDPGDDSASPTLSKEQRLKLKLKKKDLQIHHLAEENAVLKSECELLRGRLFLLTQRLSWE